MKFKIFLISCLFLLSRLVQANNIQISNVELTSQNIISDFTLVQFDITWENSWRYAGGPANWDAAWIFIKYRIRSGEWKHAWLNNTDHMACNGATISVGLSDPTLNFHTSTNPGIGVFLYRSAVGAGDFACPTVKLRWNYGSNGVGDDEQIEIKVFAIEHVYIPESSFKAGSGGTEVAAIYTYPTLTNPFLISSEAQIDVGTAIGNLYYPTGGNGSGDRLGPIPASFPKGFNDFYVMKYELSQQGYVDFLNTLTRTQQDNRTHVDLSTATLLNQFVLSNSNTVFYRNGVWCRGDLPIIPSPVVFNCNYNENTIGNEINDGQNIACNELSWDDYAAYLDWAGLRPMTELEYEKCSRGPVDPSPNEFAWGNNFAVVTQVIIDEGLPTETLPSTVFNFHSTIGPIRCGAYARPLTDRTYSGASYYGVLDLSSNLWERCISIGHPTGRMFQPYHGDGNLTASGSQNVSTWPESTGAGAGLRGGSFFDNLTGLFHATSNRHYAANPFPQAIEDTGGRAVRTAP